MLSTVSLHVKYYPLKMRFIGISMSFQFQFSYSIVDALGLVLSGSSTQKSEELLLF
jgi:hypothetical protein